MIDREALRLDLIDQLYRSGGMAYFAGEQRTVEQANEALKQLGASKLLPVVSKQSAKTALYRHYAKGNQLLYVGISLHAALRLIGHKASAEWLYQVERIDVEWHANRKLAEKAEQRAIKTESPAHNVRHAQIPATRVRRKEHKRV